MAIVLPHLHRLLIMATRVDKRQTHRIQTVVAANARSKMLDALFSLMDSVDLNLLTALDVLLTEGSVTERLVASA
jgi:hypothetical protein